MLDHAGALRLTAHHETGGVMQPDNRRAGLITGLHKMRDLVAAGRI